MRRGVNPPTLQPVLLLYSPATLRVASNMGYGLPAGRVAGLLAVCCGVLWQRGSVTFYRFLRDVFLIQDRIETFK